MTFVEAIRRSRWVRRRIWPYHLWVGDKWSPRACDTSWDKVTREDMTASDWIIYDENIDVRDLYNVSVDENDDASLRFSLIELE